MKYKIIELMISLFVFYPFMSQTNNIKDDSIKIINVYCVQEESIALFSTISTSA